MLAAVDHLFWPGSLNINLQQQNIPKKVVHCMTTRKSKTFQENRAKERRKKLKSPGSSLNKKRETEEVPSKNQRKIS